MPWSSNPLAASNDREIGHVDAVVAEDLFRDAFAFAQSQAGGAAPGERQALQREERGDILIERAIIPELVGKIKNHIRLECLQLLAEQIEVIVDREVLRGMAKLFERGQHSAFGFAVFGLQGGAQVLIDGGLFHRIEQRQNFEQLSLHCSYLVRLNAPVNK